MTQKQPTAISARFSDPKRSISSKDFSRSVVTSIEPPKPDPIITATPDERATQLESIKKRTKAAKAADKAIEKAIEGKHTPKPLMQTYEKLGFECEEDLVLWVPKTVKDFTLFFQGVLVEDESSMIFDLELTSKPSQSKGANKIELVGVSFGQVFHFNFFGKLFFHPCKEYGIGTRLFVHGKPQRFGSKWFITNPEIIPEHLLGKVHPLYESIRGKVNGENLGLEIACLMDFKGDALLDEVRNRIAENFRGASDQEIYKMCSISQQDLMCPTPASGKVLRDDLRAVLYSLHKPSSLAELYWAKNICKMIAAGQIRCNAVWASQKPTMPQAAINIPDQIIERAIGMTKLTLTNAQRRCVNEIVNDLRAPFAMDRLLSGDVGFGKTLTYAIPLACAHYCGARVAVMIQNTLLVSQVAKEIKKWFPDIPVMEFKTGSKFAEIDIDGEVRWSKKSDSPEMIEFLKTRNPILLGTTGIINPLLSSHYHLDVLVIDEQQKLSTQQRAQLRHDHTNILQATATCVPRSAALVYYGGSDQSIIDESPVVKNIKTHVVTPELENGRVEMFKHVKATCQAQEKVLVIYSRVTDTKGQAEDGQPERLSIEAVSKRWEAILGKSVSVLHGRQSPEDKKTNMDAFVSGSTNLMVASTVIEIGVSIPSIRILVVVDADLYGVSTLHQMRGRLARNGGDGVCYLYCSNPVEDETLQRLHTVAKYNNGFVLAEKDMEARGFGDVSGATDDQAGKSRTLFPNIKLMPSDITRIDFSG